MSDTKIIELNKTRFVFLTLAALVFVALGVWVLTLDEQVIANQRKFNSPVLVNIIGIAAILFFGLCAFVGVRKLFDRAPGLIISREGIVDNSSGLSAGLIPWSEITGISEYQIQRQKTIAIHVKNPDQYIDNGNRLKRMANRANMKMSGTPVNIAASSLKIGYDDLLRTIGEFYQLSVSGTG